MENMIFFITFSLPNLCSKFSAILKRSQGHINVQQREAIINVSVYYTTFHSVDIYMAWLYSKHHNDRLILWTFKQYNIKFLHFHDTPISIKYKPVSVLELMCHSDVWGYLLDVWLWQRTPGIHVSIWGQGVIHNWLVTLQLMQPYWPCEIPRVQVHYRKFNN